MKLLVSHLLFCTLRYRMSNKKISSFFMPVSKRLKSSENQIIEISSVETDDKNKSILETTEHANLLDESPTKTNESRTNQVTTDNLNSTELVKENESLLEPKYQELFLSTLLNEVEGDWKTRLMPQTRKPYFKSLDSFIQSEMKQFKIFPTSDDIFSAFKLCPFENVRVVIIGQDPYHGPNQAHGLAFSVQKNVRIPPSLRNMITELIDDPDIQIQNPKHGNLESWCRQGVLLLNTCLTVREDDANSHQKKGWEEFTDAVVKELGTREGIVYLLWGKPAQLKCRGINPNKNLVITCSHPSPLAAYKTNTPFMGSRCFSKCNKWLLQKGYAAIDWNIS